MSINIVSIQTSVSCIDAYSFPEQLSAKISSLESELDDYKLQITSLTNDKKSLNDELDKLKQDNLKLEEQQSEIDKLNTLIKSEPIDEPVAETVYWVSGGKVYHSTSSCSTLKRSSNIQSGTITQSGKSRACKVCY